MTGLSRVPTREITTDPRPQLQPYLVERGDDVFMVLAPDAATSRAVVRDRARLIPSSQIARITPMPMTLIEAP